MKKLCHVMLSLLFMRFFTSCGNDEVENVLNVGEMMRLEGEFVSVMDNQSCEVCNNVGEFVSVVEKIPIRLVLKLISTEVLWW